MINDVCGTVFYEPDEQPSRGDDVHFKVSQKRAVGQQRAPTSTSELIIKHVINAKFHT